ncbi:MAG: M20 family metallopeptidase [Thermomicrobiales bacterium]
MTTPLDRVLQAIDDRRDEIVDFAAALVQRPSVNPDLDPNDDAERPAAEFLRDHYATWPDWEVDYYEVAKNRPNVVASRRGKGGGRSLIWASHHDVVPVSPEQREAWIGDPFSGEVRDGKLWGRGASDMKGPIAAYSVAAKIMQEEGVQLKGDLILSQTPGEESGRRDIGCNTVLERGHRADFAIFPEVSNFAIHPVAKGELYFKLTVPGKSTHICYRNLVAQPLPYGVERPGVSAIDNMLKYQLAILEMEKQWGLWRSNEHVEPGGMYININTMRAGSSLSSIPDSAEATGSLLFNPDLSAEEVMAEIRACIDRVTAADYWLREHPPTLDLPLDSESDAPWIKEAVNLPLDHPMVGVIQNAMVRVTGSEAPVGISPFVCDANFWFPLGQECLIWGIGDVSWGVHGANEFIPVDDLVTGAKAFAATTMEWCGVA